MKFFEPSISRLAYTVSTKAGQKCMGLPLNGHRDHQLTSSLLARVQSTTPWPIIDRAISNL